MPAALEILGLTKVYGGVRVVDGLDLTAPRDAVTALLGPNGAGKTTTVECCEGLRHADAGTVRVLGLDPVDDGPAVRARVGVMLQDGGLPAAARAGAVLRHVASMYAAPRDPATLVDRLGLGTVTRTPVRHLSGGQRQRLALACAVVGRPELVFLDEPTAGLDPQARLAVWDLVRELRAAGTSVVLTTHLMAEAETLADEVAIIDRGTVITRGSPAGLVTAAGGAGPAVRFEGPPGIARRLAADVPGVSVEETTPGAYTARTTAAPGTDKGEEPGLRSPVGRGHAEDASDDVALTALVAVVSGWAARCGVPVTGFATRRRTLEDLFLDLTGRELR